MFRKDDGGAQREAVGIDIGPHTIKVVILEDGEAGATVKYAIRVPTPALALQNSVVTDVRLVGRCIRQALRSNGVSVAAASLSVPNEISMVRWIDLPRMDEATLETAAAFEARKYLNYPVGQADLRIVPMDAERPDAEENIRALLVATPQNVSRTRAQAVEEAGIRVTCIEVEAFSLMRALYTPHMRRDMVWSSQSRAYLQLGNDSSSMYVLQNSTIRFVRGLSWGSGRLAAALKAAIGCTDEHAQQVIVNGFASISPQGTLFWVDGTDVCESDALEPELERLCKEIQRLINYYLSLFPERSYEGILNQIILCGGAAGLKGLKDFLANRLEIEFNLGDPVAARGLQIAPTAADSVDSYRAGFTVAIGLALGGLQSNARLKPREHSDVEYVWRRQAA